MMQTAQHADEYHRMRVALRRLGRKATERIRKAHAEQQEERIDFGDGGRIPYPRGYAEHQRPEQCGWV